MICGMQESTVRHSAAIDFAVLARDIKRWGAELGFQKVGIADRDLSAAEARLIDWLGKGFHGDMDYMAKHGAKRSRPAELVPGTLRVIVAQDSPGALISFEYNTTAAQTNDPIINSISAGTKIVLMHLECNVSAATTAAATDVRIGFGAASVPAKGASGADAVSGVVMSLAGVPPGSGEVKGTGGGKISEGASDEELRITCAAPTGGELRITGAYYTTAA